MPAAAMQGSAMQGAAMQGAPIRIAIVGPGKIARDAHLPALAGSAAFSLAACVSDAAGLPDVPCFPTIAALREAMPAVTAVAICTPPQVRARLAAEAIAAGLHVLLEKPPAATLSDCAALEQAAARCNVTLFAAWHSRFAPMVPAARDWLAERRITGGRIEWREDVRCFHPGQTWLWQPGGLGVFDCGINALSILTAIAPVPVALRAARFAVPGNAAAPIAVSLDLACGGAAVSLELDFLHAGPPCWRMVLDCGDEQMTLERGGAALTVPGRPARQADGGEYAGVYARFAALIGAGGSDCDAAPLRLVADAFMLARVTRAPDFTP